MDRFRLVPGSPSFHWRSRATQLDGHQLFSYARHAMIQFLAFLKHRKAFEKLRLLLPRYMCHEVIITLRQHAEHVSFFSQAEDFSFNLAQIREQCVRENINVVLISHLYGKRISVEPLRGICDELGIVLLEDSAHLPWFVLEDEPQYSHARIFTYRKLFALPYGASIRVCPAWRAAFASYCETEVEWKSEPFAGLAFFKWLARDSVKALIKGSGMTWRRAYAELGIDPLREFNCAPGVLRLCMQHLRDDQYVGNRKRNYELLRREFTSNFSGWKILDCNGERDVPYQFLIYQNTSIDAVSILDRFLYFGVSAVKGLELLPETRAQLGKDHPFNNQIGLPIHQDLSRAQIDHILETCRTALA